MKILQIHNHCIERGGSDSVFDAERELLESHGHTVVRYTAHNREIEGRGLIRTGIESLWNRRCYAELSSLIRAESPSIAHFHNTYPIISPAGYAAAKKCGLPVVQTMHDFRLLCANTWLFRNSRPCEDCIGRSIAWPAVVHRCYKQSYLASTLSAATMGIARRQRAGARHVDRFIALSYFARERYVRDGFAPERVVIKPNFVVAEAAPGGGMGGYGLFVGRLTAEKGVQTLIRGWQLVGNDAPLKIVGDGPLRPMVEAAAARQSNVQFLGLKAPPEVRRLMDEAAFIVFPSEWYEGCPMVLIEAFSRGTPVIAAAIGAAAEMVDDGRTGLHFTPGDPVDLAAKVKAAVCQPDCLQQMRHDARNEYEQRYSAEENYRQLMQIYAAAGAA